MDCSLCAPGWGLVTNCSATVDTLCEPCGPSHWSPKDHHLTKCSPCSKCGEGLYVDKACTPFADTVCDSCSTSQGRFNSDFIRKCLEADEEDSDETGSDSIRFFKSERSKGRFLPGVSLQPPVNRVPDDGNPEHEFWAFGPDQTDSSIPYKPSYHSYDAIEMMRHRRVRAYVFLGITVMLLIFLISFFIRMTMYLCAKKKHRTLQYKPLPAWFSDADMQIINQCAHDLQNQEEKGKRFHSRYSVPADVEDQYWEDDPTFIHGSENPLERLMHNEHRHQIA